MRLPSFSSTGRTRARAASVPPTMMVSVPSIAFGTAPDTGAAECHHGGGHAAVDRGLQQDLLDLVLREAVVQGAVEMELELMLLAERGQHAEVQHRAHLARQPGPVPDVVPAVGVEQLGELAVELVNPGHRLVDSLGAEHVETGLQAGVVAH